MTDEQWALVCALPLHDMCNAILDDAPKTSAAELLAAAEATGKADGRAKAYFKRVRDAHALRKGERAPDPVEADDAPTLPAVHARIAEALAARDYRAAASWSRTLAIMTGLEPEADPDAGREADWGALTEPERAAMGALVRKAYGEAPDTDGLWWAALFARVPADPTTVHPAHVPLPDAPRPATPEVP